MTSVEEVGFDSSVDEDTPPYIKVKVDMTVNEAAVAFNNLAKSSYAIDADTLDDLLLQLEKLSVGDEISINFETGKVCFYDFKQRRRTVRKITVPEEGRDAIHYYVQTSETQMDTLVHMDTLVIRIC